VKLLVDCIKYLHHFVGRWNFKLPVFRCRRCKMPGGYPKNLPLFSGTKTPAPKS